MSIAYYSEWIAAVTATVCFFKYKHLPIRTILLLLWITVIAESAAIVWIKLGHTSNHWIYNIYAFCFYVIIYKMVYDYIIDVRRKKIVLLLSVLFFIGGTVRFLFIPRATDFLIHVNNAGMLLLVVLLLYYAIDLLKSDRPLNLKKQLELFIFSGYLFFGISFIPLSIFVFGAEESVSKRAISIFSDIQRIIVVIMYLIFTFGFIWTRPQTTGR